MKRFVALLLSLLLLLCGCTSSNSREISIEDIVAAYEDAGYSVWAKNYDKKLESGEIACVQADHPDGNYIYFSVFETEQEAKAYKEEYYHPVMISLFSFIYGQPSWLRWKVYGCIVVKYDDSKLFEPFQQLLKGT